MMPSRTAAGSVTGARARGYEARRRPGLRGASAAAGATCPFTSLRPWNMMAIEDAMNTVEYVPLMMPTSIVKAKPLQHLATEQVERDHAQQRRPGRDDRPRQRLVHRDVDDMREMVPAHAAHVLADAIEDDDRVVDRVAGNRQQAGDHVQRQVVLEEGQEREADEQVVERGGDGADGKTELKAERDVGQDAAESEHRGHESLPLQLLAHHRSDDFRADDGEVAQPRLAHGGDDGVRFAG